jgi:hypothetical protein
MALVLLSLSLIFIFGCSENSSVSQPVNDINPTVTKSISEGSGMVSTSSPAGMYCYCEDILNKEYFNKV